MAEEFSTEELHSSMLKWLESCLELGGTMTFDPVDVNDGNSLAECLLQLVPEFFTSSWRARIISETGRNWKLKLNNLKKILRSIQEYYDTVLHISLNKVKMPDLALVAETSSKEDTARLIQLALGIAINCDHKDMYIQAIMGMQQDVQHVVMGAIQDLMSQQSPSMVTSEDYRELEEENKKAVQELEKLKEERERLQQQNHELSTQLKVSQGEMADLTTEMEVTREKLKTSQTSSGMAGEGKALQLQRLLDANKMEKLKLEAERDDLRHKCEETDGQLQEVLERNRNLTLENEEIPILRDTVEEMKYLESKVKNYESVISQYKKKVEDAQELRKQLKVTEDRNIMYMQQNMDLEEELRRQGGLRKQLDTQRQKLQELEGALAQEKLRCLEATQEAEEKAQAADTLRGELVRVRDERDNLSQQVPGTPVSGAFKLFSAPGSERAAGINEPDLGLGGGGGGEGLVEAFTPALREKMMRLEKENQILRRRVETAESASSEPAALVTGGTGEQSVEQRVLVEHLKKEGAEWKQRAKDAELTIKKYAGDITALEEMKKAKDVEIEKYKKYLNKAKKIIENIGDRKTQGAEENLEIQSLKTQLKEKDRQLEQLEREYHQGRSSWEREEKLVVSAWHEMGLMMHRKYSQERLLTKQNKSFLAQQRQSLYKNPVPINTAMASTPLAATGDASHS